MSSSYCAEQANGAPSKLTCSNVSASLGLSKLSLDESVVCRVLAQAAATPTALAVSSNLGDLSYKELIDRASRLAERLRVLGIGAESVVALSLPRCPGFIVAALGVMQAGAAYLPLDTLDPEPRRAAILKDAQARGLVAKAGEANAFAEAGLSLILIDDLGRVMDLPRTVAHGDSSGNALKKASAEALAYVIYTSGSSGSPKGVEITHGNLCHLLDWHQQAFQPTPRDRATQVARLGFDAAVWELWPYLTAGASVHLPPDEILNVPKALQDWLIAEQITKCFVPTPLVERLLALRWPAATSLKIMLTGGDVLHRYPAANLPFELVNNYGPTECTVVATSGVVQPESDGSSQRTVPTRPPIGRAIGNTRLWVLDESMQPVPEGTVGELYVGGPSVARGYRNRPDLTNLRFVQDPFSGEGPSRLFKTGDLVQWLPDGQLKFYGRVDDQVKVRGFRIEPHEIVAALDAHPAINQSAVAVQALQNEHQRLVAYIVPSNGALPQPAQLREFLQDRLPDYMVPALFVRSVALPLTRNGKVDRASLPAPDSKNILRDESFTAPRTEVEKTVAGLLGPLLGLDQLDVNANFFALGGHSLLGTQLLTRVRATFGVELPLRSIFEAPSVADLAAEIERLLPATEPEQVQTDLRAPEYAGQCT